MKKEKEDCFQIKVSGLENKLKQKECMGKIIWGVIGKENQYSMILTIKRKH